MLIIYIAAFTGRRDQHTMYISFPWRVQALHNCLCFWHLESYSCTQDSFTFKRSYHSLETVRKTIFDQNRLCCDNQ